MVRRKSTIAADPVLDSVEYSLRQLTRTVFLPPQLKKELRETDRSVLKPFSEALTAIVKKRRLEHAIVDMQHHGGSSSQIEIYNGDSIMISKYAAAHYDVSIHMKVGRTLSSRVRCTGAEMIIPADANELYPKYRNAYAQR